MAGPTLNSTMEKEITHLFQSPRPGAMAGPTLGVWLLWILTEFQSTARRNGRADGEGMYVKVLR